LVTEVADLIRNMEGMAKKLEQDAQGLRTAIEVLRRRQDQKPSVNGVTSVRPKSDFADLTSQQAVDRVIAEAPGPITAVDIVEEGGRRGKRLNINTVRWVIHMRQREGKIERVGRSAYQPVEPS
jgi:hypothetical protein